MKLFFRILLFVLCIGVDCITEAQIAAPASTSAFKDYKDYKDYEVLEKNYVQLEVSNDYAIHFSIIKSFESLVKIIREKYYSLLNWSARTRYSNLQIENYNRTAKFGRWINDPNDNTCFNTRAVVLLRDSDQDVVFKDTNRCSVSEGRWNDPYTGQIFRSSTDIQIDHFVPLKNAYMSGAYKWSFKTRCLYANFLGSNYHLLSVNGSQNMKKGDRAPDKYIPPNSSYTCTYIKNWLSVKLLWGLKMSPSEAMAISTAIKENHCNARSLYISDREILRQSQFYRETIDLCEKLDTTNKEKLKSN